MNDALITISDRMARLAILIGTLNYGQNAFPETGAVSIEQMIGPNFSASGGANMIWDLYSFPQFSSDGTAIFKSRFLETEGDIPKGGYAFVEWTGSNTGKLLVRDLDFEYKSLQFAPFSSTTEGLFFGATPEDEQQNSIYKGINNRIEQDGTLRLASDKGTVFFTDILENYPANISVIYPDGQTRSLVKSGDPVPGLDGVNFKGLYREHITPNGGLALATSLSGPNVDFTNDWALCKTDSQDVLLPFAREGAAHPSAPQLAVNGTFIELAYNQTGFGFNGAGAAAFTALVTNPEPQGVALDTLWYVPSESHTPNFVAAVGLPIETANEGTITFHTFRYAEDGAHIQPLVDSSGNIIFFATLKVGTDTSRPAIWKWDGEDFSKIIDLDNLPLDGVENKTVTINDVCLSPRGRIALFGVADGLAQIIWAQDDKGNFANVITRNPFSEPVYPNQNLVLSGGQGLGKINSISPAVGITDDASGGEDGLLTPWWTPQEKLMFSAQVVGGEATKAYICQATIGKALEIPSGVTYIWDEHLSTLKWHDIENSETNWVDSKGVRWDKPPTHSNAKVIIPEGFYVELHQTVDEIASLESQGNLELFASLQVREKTDLRNLAVRGENALVSAGEVIANGDISGGVSAVRVISPLPNSPITTKGIITGADSGLWVTAPNGIDIDNAAKITAIEGGAIIATSVTGDIAINNRATLAAGNGHAITATSESGNIDITSTQFGSVPFDLSAVGIGINASTAGDIAIYNEIEISTLSGQSAYASSNGILAQSSGGSVSIIQKNDISTFQIGTSPAIGAYSAMDLTINSAGNFSTFSGPGIYAKSENGSIEINHAGNIAGGGIAANAENGFIIINGASPTGALSATDNASTGDGIQATAGESISIFWPGDISTFGSNGASAIYATSTNAAVSVTTKGSVSAFGTSSYGAVLSGPSKLTLTILGGGIGGGDGIGAGVVLSNGTENLVTNRGTIDAYSFNAIKTSSGNETIDNYGRISGDIDLGEGLNVIENRSGASIVTHDILTVGAANSINNAGLLQIGELGQPTRTTTLTGNLVTTPSASYRMEIEDTTIAGDLIADHLIINGDAQIDGELIVHLQEDYVQPKAGDTFTFLTANSITGTFSSVRVVGSSLPDSDTSRKVTLALTYSPNSISGTFSLINIDSYAAWRAHFFNETQQLDESISGPDADPDKDGVSNGDEALFGGNPLLPNASPVSFDLTHIDTQNGFSVTATFDAANSPFDREWYFESSANLTDWSPASVTEIDRTNNGDFSRISVSFNQTLPSLETVFLRLRSRTKAL